MNCQIIGREEKAHGKCSPCGKRTCECHLYKRKENTKSKQILDEICEKCLDREKGNE